MKRSMQDILSVLKFAGCRRRFGISRRASGASIKAQIGDVTGSGWHHMPEG